MQAGCSRDRFAPVEVFLLLQKCKSVSELRRLQLLLWLLPKLTMLLVRAGDGYSSDPTGTFYSSFSIRPSGLVSTNYTRSLTNLAGGGEGGNVVA